MSQPLGGSGFLHLFNGGTLASAQALDWLLEKWRTVGFQCPISRVPIQADKRIVERETWFCELLFPNPVGERGVWSTRCRSCPFSAPSALLSWTGCFPSPSLSSPSVKWG